MATAAACWLPRRSLHPKRAQIWSWWDDMPSLVSRSITWFPGQQLRPRLRRRNGNVAIYVRGVFGVLGPGGEHMAASSRAGAVCSAVRRCRAGRRRIAANPRSMLVAGEAGGGLGVHQSRAAPPRAGAGASAAPAAMSRCASPRSTTPRSNSCGHRSRTSVSRTTSSSRGPTTPATVGSVIGNYQGCRHAIREGLAERFAEDGGRGAHKATPTRRSWDYNVCVSG